jgi:two-component system, cell cycle response regulator DivK
VLVVDDTEDNRELYAQFLLYAGYRVEVAVDGYEALEKTRALRPDVVIMDLALPGMDGWETTRHLKADEDTRDIPVIALTGHVVGDSRARALAVGCGAFLAKPCSLDVLLLEVRRALDPAGS